MSEHVFDRARQQRREQRIGFHAPTIAAIQHREPHQVLRDQAVVIGNRIVDAGMRANDQTFRIIGTSVPGVDPKSRLQVSALSSRFACESSAPFGCPVVPEV